MNDPKKLSDRIGKTTLIIDDLAAKLRYGVMPDVRLGFDREGAQQIPPAFAQAVVKAVHAVLMQARAVDAIHLAQAAGVPAVAEGVEDDLNVVVIAPKSLAPESED